MLYKKCDAQEDSAGVVIMPPAVLIGCFVLGGLLEWSVGGVGLPGPRMLHWGLGMVLAVFGCWFMMWGHNRFRSLGVNVPPVLPVSQLVVDGAHRYSRNPMYVGIVFILVGLGICFGSSWLVLSALGMISYLSFYVVPKEEAYLTRRFGDEYREYCQSVRRWL